MKTEINPDKMTDDELADWLETDEAADQLLEQGRVYRAPVVEALMRARDARAESERALVEAVAQAHRDGISWTGIGQVLDMSRQGARQYFGPRIEVK